MILTLIIGIITILTMLVFILRKPTVQIRNHSIETFWIIALVGALLMIVTSSVSLSNIKDHFTANSSINPLRILIILCGMALISITLDELHFFNYLAIKAIKFNKNSQYKLFFTLYLLVAFLTIFTSNDIVILTFTLFIIYFSRETKINPIPYLVMEFVVANTYSMLFIIGNPTNIYLATLFDIDFISYFEVMWLPTLLAGVTSVVLLLLLFHKELSKPIAIDKIEDIPLKNKPLTIICLCILILTTVFLAISNYLDIAMWIISGITFVILSLILIIYSLKTKTSDLLKKTYKRLPYNLIVFVCAMFIIVLALKENGVFDEMSSFFNSLTNSKNQTILVYGTLSTLGANMINNIPMSIAFPNIIINCLWQDKAIYATIIGSNIGAFLTPIGALAGIMWMDILKRQNVPFSFMKFVKYGCLLSTIILLSALLGLIIK